MNRAAELYDAMIDAYFKWTADHDDDVIKDKFLTACEEFCYNEYENPFEAHVSDPSPVLPDGMNIITSVVR